MSIFGKLDAANVPANPYFIEEGEYSGEITKAEYRNHRDGYRQLFIEFTVGNEESMFKGRKAGKYFRLVDPDLTAEMYEMLPADDKAAIFKDLSNLKRALCGFGKNKGLGVDEASLNDDSWDPKSLVGTRVDFAISNWGDDKQGVNVIWANVSE